VGVLSGFSEIEINLTGVDNRRHFDATAATQDTAAGSSVTLTVRSMVGVGATSPAAPDSLKLKIVNTAGNVLIKEFTFTAGHPSPGGAAISQAFTFFFTANGDSGGAARSGTVEMVLEAVRTSGIAGTNYNIQSDGSNDGNSAAASGPTGSTLTLNRGWVRGTTTATVTTSNVAAGGAKPSVYAYTTPTGADGGDSVFHRVTLAAPTYETWTATHTISGATPALSASSASAQTQTFDATFTRVVDNRFPASSSAQTAGVGTVPNASLNNTAPNSGGGSTGQPYVGLTVTTDSLTVDPRVTRRPLFQIDDNTFATPPLSKNLASHERATHQTGFMAERFTNARSEGVNGLTYTLTLTPTKPGDTVTATGKTSTTQGGEAGWASALTPWVSGLPGGTWTKAIAVTAPADITGAAYFPLAAGENETYTLLAVNPNLKVVTGAGSSSAATDGDHWHPGLPLLVGLAVFDIGSRQVVDVDDPGLPKAYISLARFNVTSGRAEYLTATPDVDGSLTWAAANGATVHEFQLARSPGDNLTFIHQFSATETAGWGTADLFVIPRAVKDGTPYSTFGITEVPDVRNRHDAYAFDPTGLFR
jgi:hypothetical protein